MISHPDETFKVGRLPRHYCSHRSSKVAYTNNPLLSIDSKLDINHELLSHDISVSGKYLPDRVHKVLHHVHFSGILLNTCLRMRFLSQLMHGRLFAQHDFAN